MNSATKPNVKLSGLFPPVEPMDNPPMDLIGSVGWWALLALTAYFWYWVGQCVGLVA